jgi:hypothetical protein
MTRLAGGRLNAMETETGAGVFPLHSRAINGDVGPIARVRTQVEVPVEIGPGEFIRATMHSFSGLCEPVEHLAVAIRGPLRDAAPRRRIHTRDVG